MRLCFLSKEEDKVSCCEEGYTEGKLDNWLQCSKVPLKLSP